MKWCPRCETEKETGEFGVRLAAADGLQSYCKPCQKEYRTERIANGEYDPSAVGRAYYERNREDLIAAQLRKKWVRKAQLVAEHGGKCIQCGYSKSLAALTFHHRDPSDKLFEIGAKCASYGIDRLREEAKKCDLLCFNCHMEEEFPDLPEVATATLGSWVLGRSELA